MAMYGGTHALRNAWSPGAVPLRHSGTCDSMRAKENAARKAIDSPCEGGHRHGRVRVGAGAGSLDGVRVLLGSLRSSMASSSANVRRKATASRRSVKAPCILLVSVWVHHATFMQRPWSDAMTTPFLPLHPAFNSCQ